MIGAVAIYERLHLIVTYWHSITDVNSPLLFVRNTLVTGGPLPTEFLAYTDTLYCTPGRRLERVICVEGRVYCRTVPSVMLVRVTV